jgi:hypothetical protein
MRNAKHIGIDLAKSVGLNLGKPIQIYEESCKEIEGTNNASGSTEIKRSLNDLIEEKTITVIVNLNVTFELKANKKPEI